MTYPGKQHGIIVQAHVPDSQPHEEPGTEQEDSERERGPKDGKKRRGSIHIGIH